MNIISIVQQHYSQKSTLSIPAPIADVRRTFAAIAETGLYVELTTFKVQYSDNIVQLYGPFGLKVPPLVTTISIEPDLDRNRTTFNVNTQFTKSRIIFYPIFNFILFLVFIYIGLQFYPIKLDPVAILALLIVDGIFTYYYIWMNFEFSRKMLIEHLERVQVWDGLGSHKALINNPWIRSIDKRR
jgi:hypothetical protein